MLTLSPCSFSSTVVLNTTQLLSVFTVNTTKWCSCMKFTQHTQALNLAFSTFTPHIQQFNWCVTSFLQMLQGILAFVSPDFLLLIGLKYEPQWRRPSWSGTHITHNRWTYSDTCILLWFCEPLFNIRTKKIKKSIVEMVGKWASQYQHLSTLCSPIPTFYDALTFSSCFSLLELIKVDDSLL